MVLWKGLLIAAFVLVAAAGQVAAEAGGACCTRQGTCEDISISDCEALDGILVQGAICADSPCNVMVPAVSPAALAALVTALLTLAIYGLMRRRARGE